jgi:hypothetical protein
MTFVPADFYGLDMGANVTAINCVFNAGDWAAGEGKAFDAEGNCVDFMIELMPGGGGSYSLEGTWHIANEAGCIGVGPTQGDISWWNLDDAGIVERACYMDDAYVFGSDGSFMNVMGADTWVEEWQGNDPPGCAAPVAPHDGSNAATYTWDEGASTVTLNGVGAFLGLAKVFNGGELTAPGDAPESITYMVEFSNDGNRITVDIEISGGWWRYILDKEVTREVRESTVWMITFTPADYYGIEEGANVEAIDAVFNGGAWENGEAKDFDGEGNCIDFKIMLGETGIFETPKAVTFNIYPNPANTVLNIENMENASKVEIFNVVGSVVKTIEVGSQNATIDVSGLNKGIYFVSVYNETGVQTTKFIKE